MREGRSDSSKSGLDVWGAELEAGKKWDKEATEVGHLWLVTTF